MAGSDLEIIFKTKAELDGAKATEAQLQRQIGQAKALGEDYSALAAKLAKVQASLATVKEDSGHGIFDGIKEGLSEVIPGFDKVSNLATKLASGPLGAIAGGFAALGAALEGAKKGLEEYAQAEERVAQLQAALSQSGQLTDEYSESLQDLASELQRTTAIADDQWIPVLTRLTQFGADSSNIEQYAEAVKNLAGLMGGDIQGAATLFSRAIEGNFEMFGRYGITVQDAGTETEKLEKLMQQLALRGGGQLEAAANTLNGQFRSLKNNTADLFEAIGRGIARTGVVQTALQGLSDAASFWGNALGGPIGRLEGLENAAKKTGKALMDDKEAFTAFTKTMESMATASEQSAKAFDHQFQKAQLLKGILDRLDEAQKKRDIAEIERQQIQGKLTPEEAAQAKGAVDEKYLKRGADREQGVLLAESVRNQALVNQAAFEAMAAKQRVEAKEKEMGGKSPDSATAMARNMFKQLDDAKAELGRLPSEALGPMGGAVNSGFFGLAGGIFDAKRTMDMVKKDAELRDRIKKLEDSLGGATRPEDSPAVRSAVENQKELEALKKDADDKEKKKQAAEAEYTRSKELLDIRTKGASQISEAERAATKAQSENEQIKAHKEEEERKDRENKKKFDDYQKRKADHDPRAFESLQGASNDFKDTGKDLASLVSDVFGTHTETLSEVVDAFEQMRSRVDNLSERVNNLRLS